MIALDNTMGALFIGLVIASVLYGCTCIQTLSYCTRYPSDMWHNKCLVASLFISDTCHQALITHSVYTYLVSNFGDFKELEKVVWSLTIEVFFNGFTALVVQSFWAMRVYKLSNKSWLSAGSIMLLVIAQFLSVLVYAVKTVRFDKFVQTVHVKALAMAINAISAAADLLIAVSLCYLLHGSRTAFRRTDTMINRMIMFTINTGLLTSLCALGSLICISAWPNTFLYIAFYFCIGRLYCNSLLATLNARKGLRGGSHSIDTSFYQGTRRVMNRTKPGASPDHTSNISIKVSTTHEYIQDEYSFGDTKDPEAV